MHDSTDRSAGRSRLFVSGLVTAVAGSLQSALLSTPPRLLRPLNSDHGATRPAALEHRAFTAFSRGDFRIFFFAASAAMMADNIEHVISYWVIFQQFHSAALGGFAVISHWVPYLAFAGFSGRLADRFDVRRLIQTGMLLLAGVSIGWGVMFLTHSAAMWKAMVLLAVHGMAGVIWIPASQVLIHEIVSHRGVAERGSAHRNRALSGVSRRPCRGRRIVAGIRPDPRHFHQCADLRAHVRCG